MSGGDPIRVECHACGHVMKAPATAGGRTARCTECGASVKIEPSAEPAVEVDKPTPPPVPRPARAPDESPSRTPRRTGAGERFRERREAQARVAAGKRPGLAAGAAVAAALALAFTWFGLTNLLDHEPSLAAPLVGLGVGGAALAVGGRGFGIAALAMLLSVGSLVLGRYLVLDQLIETTVRSEVTEVEEPVEEDYRATYDRLRRSAPPWARAGIDTRRLSQSDEQRLKEFLVEHEFESPPASAIRFPQIARFVREDEPHLRAFESNPPTFDDWYFSETADYREQVELREELIAEERETFDLMFLLEATFIIDKIWTLLVSGAAAAGFGFVVFWTQRDVRLTGKQFDAETGNPA